MSRVRMVCHRGACHHAPENTFAAADKALELGGAFVELDVRESADGVLFVMHDKTVDRTTNGSGPIAAMTAAEIDALDAGSWFGTGFAGEKVPRLDAYLENLKGRGGAYVELKWCDPAKVARLVRDLGMVEETFYFSFKPEMRAGLYEAAPDFRHMITLDIARSPSVAKSVFHASMVEMEVAETTPGVLEACRSLGLETMTYYEGTDEAVFAGIAESGVDYVNLDHPDIYAAVEARHAA